MNPRRANPGRTAVSAFTLIELMVVIGLMMIVLAIGVPRMVQGNRSPLGESLNAVMEACAAARRQAILTGSTSRVTIRGAEEGTGSIISAGSGGGKSSAQKDGDINSDMADFLDETPRPAPKPSAGAGFSGRIHDDVGVHFISVNFDESMDKDQVEVKFYSNGTSDEFTIGMRHESGDAVLRFVQLDSVTGLAYIKTEYEILQR